MNKEKLISQECKFLAQFVPVLFRYEPDGCVKSCGKSKCGNEHCPFSENYNGNQEESKQYLV